MFKSDFKVVADYFIQVRKNKDYKPSRQILKHVHEVLQLMAVFTKDKRFEEYQNQFIEGENATMCDILNKAEEKGRYEGRNEGRNEGKFDFAYKLIKQGLLTLEQAATSIGISTQELLAQFKQHNLVL